MSLLAALFLLSLFGYSPTHALPHPSRRTSCPTIHMIVARGSTEPQTSGQGQGVMGYVSTMISAAYQDSDSVGVVYPATLTDYDASVAQGVQATLALIEDYVAQCGDSANIVLLGYSQGAQVISTALGSGALAPDMAAHVKAVVTYGNPTFLPFQDFDQGTAVTAGIHARTSSQNFALLPYASRLLEYCDDNDLYCASGDSASVHGEYFQAYTSDVVDFVVGKFT